MSIEVVFLLGLISGVCLSNLFWIVWRIRSGKGILRIDHSDPKKDIYRFDINSLDELSNKKRIILSVDHDAKLHTQD